MLIAHQAELDRLIDGLWSDLADRLTYLVLGTLDVRTWRDGIAGRVTIAEVRNHMADFKAYMRVDITPRHRSREAGSVD